MNKCDIVYKKYLAHHGIKGQQWGVRHGPPYPLDKNGPVTIKKGSRVNSVSTYKKIALNEKGIYGFDPSDEEDAQVYRGAYSRYLQWFRGGKVYEHSFRVKQDLLLPSHEEKVNSFIDVFKENKTFKNDLKKLANVLVEQNLDTLDVGKNYLSNSKNMQNAYSLFMRGFNEDSSMVQYSIKFVEALKNKGYSAIIDDNNAGIYNKAHNPLYIFSGKDFLIERGRSKDITYSITKNERKLRERLGGVMY